MEHVLYVQKRTIYFNQRRRATRHGGCNSPPRSCTSLVSPSQPSLPCVKPSCIDKSPRGQFLKWLAKGGFASAHRSKSAKAPGPFTSFHSLAKGATRKSMFKKLAPGPLDYLWHQNTRKITHKQRHRQTQNTNMHTHSYAPKGVAQHQETISLHRYSCSDYHLHHRGA